MHNARQQHFDWEPHATAHKSSSILTSTVVCEPGETAHKSSSTCTSAVVCEPGQTAHKSAPATSAVVCQPCETALKTSPNLPFARVVWEPRASAHNTCWPGYLSSVRRDSACSGRLLIVTAFENIVPANIEQTKKGHVSYLCYLDRILAAAPHVAPPGMRTHPMGHTLGTRGDRVHADLPCVDRRVMVSWTLPIAQ